MIHGLRAVSPFVAAILATTFILFQVYRKEPRRFGFFSPLGLAAVYGLVGLFATILSPDSTVAFRWAVLYLSVPLVLWAIAWQTDALARVQQVLDVTWFCVILIALALFAVALIYLDLFDVLRDPRLILECRSGNWYGFTSGGLRDTGVGRYAAIAAIIATTGVLQRKWWPILAPVFVVTVLLLLFTGARGSMAGFAVAAPFAALLYSGKKTVAVGAIALVVFVPLFWATGSHSIFYENCILSGQVTRTPKPQVPQLPVGGTPTPTPIPTPTKIAEPALPPPPKTNTPGVTTGPSTAVVAQTPVPTPTKVNSSGTSKHGAYVPDSVPPTRVPDRPDFFTFTGRTSVWDESFELFKDSPLLGYGFHADRIILEAHVHNSLLHSLLQTGVLGTIPFLAALAFGWILFIMIFREREGLTSNQRHLLIQAGAVLAFLTVRTFPESTGAFFGVDWLLLAPILLYLNLLFRTLPSQNKPEN